MTTEEKKYLNYGFYGIAGIGLLYLIFGSSKDDDGSTEDPTGNGTTIPNSTVFNANTIAEKLYDAMKKSGTNYTQIKTALTTVNQAQFGEVIIAFGKRSYNSTTGNQINFTPWSPLPLVNLQGWFESELSDDEYETMRQKYPNYL